MSELVRRHYDTHPYPRVPLLASVRRCDTYPLNLTTLWARFNGELLAPGSQRILLAGCGTFSPYPFSLANPKADIVAIDLSEASLARARLHMLLHGCRNVTTRPGDLLSPRVAEGPFHFIDAFGVVHHLDDPLAGVEALAGRLDNNGIIRLMVYSRGARGEIESVRRGLRLLRVKDPETARKLLSRAPADSRLGACLSGLGEGRSIAGFADAFLHPSVRIFGIDELMAMIGRAGLHPLLFAHPGAVRDIGAEVTRVREAERSGEVWYNYVVYLGRHPDRSSPPAKGGKMFLNPALDREVGAFRLATTRVDGRLGSENPPLDRQARRFLRRFREPVPVGSLSDPDLAACQPYLDALFLACISQ